MTVPNSNNSTFNHAHGLKLKEITAGQALDLVASGKKVYGAAAFWYNDGIWTAIHRVSDADWTCPSHKWAVEAP